MAILTSCRVRDVICTASRRSTTTSVKFLYVVISSHRRQQKPAPAQPASPSPPPPRRRRKPQNPWVLPWILQREERGCYRTLLDELITTDISGYRNFTRSQHFFIWLKKGSPPISGSHSPISGSHWKSGWNWQLLWDTYPQEGRKNDLLQICPPSLQSHFERISTRASGVSHWSWRVEEN